MPATRTTAAATLKNATRAKSASYNFLSTPEVSPELSSPSRKHYPRTEHSALSIRDLHTLPNTMAGKQELKQTRLTSYSAFRKGIVKEPIRKKPFHFERKKETILEGIEVEMFLLYLKTIGIPT